MIAHEPEARAEKRSVACRLEVDADYTPHVRRMIDDAKERPLSFHAKVAVQGDHAHFRLRLSDGTGWIEAPLVPLEEAQTAELLDLMHKSRFVPLHFHLSYIHDPHRTVFTVYVDDRKVQRVFLTGTAVMPGGAGA